MAASGIIGTFLGVRSPGTAYVLLHHYMGEIDGAFRAWGIPKGGTGGVAAAIASAAREAGAEIRTAAPVAQVRVRGRARGRRRARERRGDRGTGRPRQHGCATHLPGPAAAGHARAGLRGRAAALPLPGLLGQGEPGPRRAALLHLAAGSRRAPARGHQLLALGRLPGAGLRRCQGGTLQPTALRRRRHPHARRPGHGTPRQARHELLRAVRPVPPRGGHLGRAARGLR